MTNHVDTIIIGAGLSGLTVAHKLKFKSPERSLAVFEKSDSTGGVIRSFEQSGFRAELGPHGFLDNCQESKDLLRETGLDRESVKAPLSTFVRYVCIDGKLKMIPQSPLKIIKAPLISWKEKFRVLGDLFRKPIEGEPTVAKWAHHRFGKALLPYVDAVFTGTYAGDYNALKIDAVMPGVRALEKEYGSVIKGAFAKARATRKKKCSGEKLEMPSMTSFPDGMQHLTRRLSKVLDPEKDLFLNCPVERLEECEDSWFVNAGQHTFSAKHVVLALPVNQALNLLRETDSTMPLESIPEAWITTVVFGFKGAKLPPGFGFLIPETENRFSLGTLFSSNMFPNRAPEGTIVFETLVGGRRHPEKITLDDEEMIRHCRKDAADLLNLHEEPVFVKVLRPKGGIPQLEKGYTSLLDWRNKLVSKHKGLFVCGFGWDGIGINDMIKKAVSVADKIDAGLLQHQEKAEVKKVYF